MRNTYLLTCICHVPPVIITCNPTNRDRLACAAILATDAVRASDDVNVDAVGHQLTEGRTPVVGKPGTRRTLGLAGFGAQSLVGSCHRLDDVAVGASTYVGNQKTIQFI